MSEAGACNLCASVFVKDLFDFILLLKHDDQEIGIKDVMPKAKVTASTAWYWLSGDTSEGRVTKCRVCGM